jgi:SAM-dependent methyltransferase
MIVSNNVLEYVRDLDAFLSDVSRLLKPDGLYLSLFPTREVWRDGPGGVPFVHWFSRRSRIRFRYALTMRRLGFGRGSWRDSIARTESFLEHLDRNMFYRSRRLVLHTFRKHFDVRLIEPEYIRFRLDSGRLHVLALGLSLPLAKTLASKLFRRISGTHVLARKRAPPELLSTSSTTSTPELSA